MVGICVRVGRLVAVAVGARVIVAVGTRVLVGRGSVEEGSKVGVCATGLVQAPTTRIMVRVKNHRIFLCIITP